MDFYSYYKERFTWGPNPYESVAQCQRIVGEMLDSPVIPHRISMESATGFLAALSDFAGDGCSTVGAYDTIMAATIEAMQQMRDAADAADHAWLLEAMEKEYSGPPYEPANYEVREEDVDADDVPEEPNPDEPDLLALEALYGVGGEAGSSGCRRPWPDWECIDKWTQSDWLKLQTFKDKMIAASEHGFLSVSHVGGILAAAKDAMCRIPLPRQVELALWATEIVDGLIVGLEDDLQEMCAGSLYSHAGRLVQKVLLSTASGQPENGPD